MWTVNFFVGLSQFVGFLPFRIVIDSRNGQTKGISRSWRYSITWWSILMAIINYSTHFLVVDALHKITPKTSSSTLVQTTLTSVFGFCFLVFTSSRFWLAFRFSSLNQAFHHMRKVELALSDERREFRKALNLRVLTGSILMFLWVFKFIFKIFVLMISLITNFLNPFF